MSSSPQEPTTTSTPSRFRTSIDARGSVDGLRILEDPMVMQLLTENELMLMEIEALRRRVSLQEAEMELIANRATSEEASAIRDMEHMLVKSDEAVAELKERDDKKVALLRPILDALVRFQYDTAFSTNQTKNSRDDGVDEPSGEEGARSRECSALTTSRPGTPSNHPHGAASPETLSEANARYEQLYHLTASYQATPSFMSSPYDALVLDALNHIIAISKTMNALVYAERDRAGAPGVRDSRGGGTSPVPANASAPDPPRRGSFFRNLARR